MSSEVPARITLAFGLQPPAGAVAAWGARAIYEQRPEPYIDLVFNRQDAAPDHSGTPFSTWVNTVGLPWLRAHCKRTWLSGSTDERVAHVEGQYAIAANPRASFGYLYIVAYDMGEAGVPPEIDTPTPAPPPPPAPIRRHRFVAGFRRHAYAPLTCGECDEPASAAHHIRSRR